MRIDFEPRRLGAVLKQIRRQHPVVRGGTSVPDASLVDEIRKRLRQCLWPKIPVLARQLNSGELRACLVLLTADKDPEILRKAAEILELRPRAQVLTEAWLHLLRRYPHAPLESVFRALLQSLGPSALKDGGRAPPWVGDWLGEGDLALGVLKYYQGMGKCSQGFESYLTGSRLQRGEGLFLEAWRRLLVVGRRQDLLAETGDRLLIEFENDVNVPLRPEFGAHLLNETGVRPELHERIYFRLKDWFGLPPDDSTRGQGFWQKVSPAIRDDFRAWAIGREIVEFFDGERADFWKPFAKRRKVRNLKKILYGAGVLLDFGSFGVVEFKSIGNAAYLYPSTVFQAFWVMAERLDSPAHFKDKTKTLRLRGRYGSDGRILHFDGWQRNYIGAIEALIASS